MLRNCGLRFSRLFLGTVHKVLRVDSEVQLHANSVSLKGTPRSQIGYLSNNTHAAVQSSLQPHFRGRIPQVCSCRRPFHTSHNQHAPPLLVLLVFKPLARITAVLGGRAVRNWWKTLPKHKSRSISETLRRDRWKIAGVICGLIGLGSMFYLYHVEEAPITHRRRFLALNDRQLSDIVQVEYEQHLQQFESFLLPDTHPLHEVVARITASLLRGNQDLHQIRDREWTVHVVNKDIKNAFVLPNGHIFVFTGLFKAVSNEQQLGIVLAHEISHVVLNHSAEQISLFELVDFVLILFMGAIWAILPNDGLAIVATWFKNKVAELLLKMPYSRLLETEADEVGLQLAAKACLDVRESQCFWEAMARHSGDVEDIALLSTHPSHSQRAKHLQELIPQVSLPSDFLQAPWALKGMNTAIKVREYCNCAPLPHRDPRTALGSAPVGG